MNAVGAKEENKQDKKNGALVEIDVHIVVSFKGTNYNANTNEWTLYIKYILRSAIDANKRYWSR